MKRMLPRSASSPILNSWVPSSTTVSSPEPIFLPQFPRTRYMCLMTLFHCEESPGRCTPLRSALDADLKDPLNPKKSLVVPKKSVERREGSQFGSILLSSSGLGEVAAAEEFYGVSERETSSRTTLVGCGGKGYGGGRGSYDGSGSQDPGSWNGNEITDTYYENMIAANPGNSLLLANYAKFLKEVKGDFKRAEEYCERAILANPNDGNVLSLYADLIWKTQNDSERAEAYFDQAIKTDPNDCYVLASYARFLWEADDVDEGDEEEVAIDYNEVGENHMTTFLQEDPLWPPLATASL